MVGHAALWEVVSANPLRSVPAPDLEAPGLSLRALLSLLLRSQQPRLQERHRPRPVLVLRALILTLDYDAGWQVGDADGGVRLIHVLATRTRGPVRIDPQIRRIQIDGLDLVLLRQDRNRDRGGVNASLRLGRRHPLHAVRAGFELEPGEGASTGNARDDLLEAPVLTGALAQDLDREPLRFGIARVHAQQISNEDRSLITARTRPDLQKDVLVIARILGNEQLVQLAFFALDRTLDAGDFLGAQAAHVCVRIREHFARVGQISLQVMEGAEAIRQRLQPGVLHG